MTYRAQRAGSALDGVATAVIQHGLGHTRSRPATTDRYVKVAASFDTLHIGAPFPPLPADDWAKDWANKSKTQLSPGYFSCAGLDRDFPDREEDDLPDCGVPFA